MATSRLPASARRKQILEVAVGVFADHGFHVATMDDVAAAAGVTKPVLYRHFESKRELYVELVDGIGADMARDVASAVQSHESPRRKVEEAFAAYFEFIKKHTTEFSLLFGADSRRDEDVIEAIRRVEDSIAEMAVPLIAADIDPAHRRVLAYGIVGIAEALGRAWATGRVATEPELMAAEVAELAWSGLRGVQRH